MSGASVAVRNSSAGEVKRLPATNRDFTVPNLLAGSYQVSVEIKGFQKWQAIRIVLNGNDTRTVKVDLKVGATTETVEVTESGIEIATLDSGEKVALITSQQFEDLSLVGTKRHRTPQAATRSNAGSQQWPE